jgi:hypothetical protein
LSYRSKVVRPKSELEGSVLEFKTSYFSVIGGEEEWDVLVDREHPSVDFLKIFCGKGYCQGDMKEG